MRNLKHEIGIVTAALLVCCMIAESSPVMGETLLERYGSVANVNYVATQLPFYSKVSGSYAQEELDTANLPSAQIDVWHFSGYTGEKPQARNNIAGRPDLKGICCTDKNESVTWNFSIEKAGLYEIDVTYYEADQSYLPITRKISIDGSVPFDEMNNVSFPRFYADAGKPLINNLGDEVSPAQKELQVLNTFGLTDNLGKYSEPFLFRLNAGTHTLRFDYIDQPIIITAISVHGREQVLPYSAVLKIYQQKDYQSAKGTVTFQAEDESRLVCKTDSAITLANDGDPLTTPQSVRYVKMNIIGGYSWRNGNQAVTWRFTVPESGLYKLTVRAEQVWNNGLSSVRQIAIDGKVPFREFEAYYFKYSRSFQNRTLSDAEGNPYLVYLEKGSHTITFTVKMGAYTDIYNTLSQAETNLSTLIRRITMITGNEPDVNYDYRLGEVIPDLNASLKTVRDEMKLCIRQAAAVSDERPAIVNDCQITYEQLDEMIRNNDSIPKRLTDLNNSLTTLGNWMNTITQLPLALDSFEITAPSQKIECMQSSFLQKFGATMQTFFISFSKDYDAVGTVPGRIHVKNTLNVWMMRGKEWGQILKELADADFTSKTGTEIKLNIIPSSTLSSATNPLLLSINSGKAPDVVLGMPSSMPVEYAIRNAVVNLSKFDDYQAVRKRFINALSIPLEYKSGTYALPETMNFRLLFYRTDIFQQLGLKIPDTWDDVYQYLLPTLYQNNMEMYIPAYFDMFLVQHGGSFYSSDGYFSGLDTDAAYQAFKQMVEFYTNYGVPYSANFFNRMRSGEMPVGIGDYSFYLQISFAAPELKGKWDVAPIPGNKEANGTVNRKTGGSTAEDCVIMSQSKSKDKAWEFLKWWTDAKTQTEFGGEVEARIGSSARWNTANVEAFEALPWTRSQLSIIQDEWKNITEQKIVLGGYYTQRYINNSLNRCVISGEPIRDAQEEMVQDINKELKRRQESYGIDVNKKSS